MRHLTLFSVLCPPVQSFQTLTRQRGIARRKIGDTSSHKGPLRWCVRLNHRVKRCSSVFMNFARLSIR